MTAEPGVARSVLVALSLGAAACVGAIDDFPGGPEEASGEERGAPAPGAGSPRATEPAPAGSPAPVAPGSAAGAVPGTPRSCGLAPRRLVKLTPAQIVSSLAALVPGARDDAPNLEGTIAVARDEFTNSARRLELPESHVEALMTAAEKVAARAMQKMSALAPCLPGGLEDDACIRTFIADFGARAFRRPLEPVESDAFLTFFRKEALAQGRAGAVSQVLQAFLISPSFLFRSELGAPAGGAGGLTAHEKAAALSYFLTDGPPDAALAMAAARGELATREQIEAQARRLLRAGASGSRGLLQFFEETLRSEDVLGAAKDAKLFPQWNAALAQAMAREPMAFIEHVLWKDDASFAKLYTADFSVVNAPLAKVYGTTTPSGSSSTFERVALPPGRRAGLLTQAGLLATQATASRSDIVLRGKFLRTRILCQVLPPPPMMVPIPPPVKGLSAREVLVQVHSKDPACASCHSLMDPLGFAYESYDAIGAWRDTESGKPVDPSGVVNGVADGPKTFGNAIELGRLMGDLPEAQQCLLGQLHAYASGQRFADVDDCRMATLVAELKRARGNLLDAVAGMVSADDFFRRAN